MKNTKLILNLLAKYEIYRRVLRSETKKIIKSLKLMKTLTTLQAITLLRTRKGGSMTQKV